MPASGEKPYRVYRGGRTKGKVPLPAREGEQRQRSTYRSGGGGPDRLFALGSNNNCGITTSTVIVPNSFETT